MKRWLWIILGLGLCTAGVVLLCNAIYTLGHTGSCASGGVYVSARPCPEGTGLAIFSIFGAIPAGLIGIVVYNLGTRDLPEAPVGLPSLLWAFLFLGIAGSLAFAAWGPAANSGDPGVDLAAIILLVIFVPMGLAPVLFGFGTAGRERRKRGGGPKPEPPRRPSKPPRPKNTAYENVVRAAGAGMSTPKVGAPSGGDVVSRLERLEALRRTGTIDDSEFERLKDDILRDS